MRQLDKIGGDLAIFDQNLPLPGRAGAAVLYPDDCARAALRPHGSSRSLFDGHLPSEAATAAIIAHPRFAEAARTVAAGLVALYQGERIVNLVMPDRVRYIISVFAMYLHF